MVRIEEELAPKTSEPFTRGECKCAPDMVNHPNHYTSGKIEVIDIIEDQLTPEEYRGYIKGQVIKYVTRERHKNGDEDLKKAHCYQERYMAYLKRQQEAKSK